MKVVLCPFSLGRLTQHHQDYTGPAIGPKMSTKGGLILLSTDSDPCILERPILQIQPSLTSMK